MLEFASNLSYAREALRRRGAQRRSPSMAPHASTDIHVRHVPVPRDKNMTVSIVELLERRLIDTNQIERIGQQIIDLVSTADSPRVVISFAKVEYLSSTMLNALIAIEKTIKKKSGQLRLSNLHADLQKVFTIMKLNKVMKICETADEAVASFKD
jgi:anti-anti-sigma factor